VRRPFGRHAPFNREGGDAQSFYTYELYMNYTAVMLVTDALERAGSADRAKLTSTLENSTFSGHVMPYGPTKFVNGRNQGAAPVDTQVLDNDIKAILPAGIRQRQSRVSDAGVRLDAFAARNDIRNSNALIWGYDRVCKCLV
jgi:hypothetical protein